jgi:hypothetical protein
MSFILDALKKSEAERNRQSGPVLMDVRFAAPRRRLPVWALVLTGILVVNLAFLVYVLLRRTAPAAAEALPAVQAAATTPSAPAPALPEPRLPMPEPAIAIAVAPALPARATTLSPDDRPAVPNTEEADADLPGAEDLKLSGIALPELRLSLHAYDTTPANRYVLLNGMKLREGDSTAEGVIVERITAAGAVLSWHSRRFLLPANP